MITVEVTWPDVLSIIIISVIYASNVIDKRLSLWSEITDLVSSYGLDSKPWLVLGDFNQIRKATEHSKSVSLNSNKRIRVFN